jgi:sulfopyruvate decarboxylase subunit alpha
MSQSAADALYATLRASGLDFFLSVPCKLLAELIDRLQTDTEIIYTPVTREEEGVGMACGAHLAGRWPAIVMQNSGFGNSSNAILSLLNYYRVPVVFVVSHRGSEGEPIEAQRMMGNAIKDLLKVIDVDQVSVTERAMLSSVKPAIEAARAAKRSLAILLPFSFWAEK